MLRKPRKRPTPSNWASWKPLGIGERRPSNYREVFRTFWENHDNARYAWRILRDGVCDGCALGTECLRDWTIEGVHLCNVRLRLLRLNWRETAWQNALRLAAAKNDAERRQVAASIEAYALSQAELIYAGSAYAPGESTAARDARCASSGGQDASYRRGSDVAHFAGGTTQPATGSLVVPIACPNGPGPCKGVARTQGGKRRFSLHAGQTAAVALPLAGGRLPARVNVKLRSLLGPGVAVTKHRTLRVR